MVFEKLDPTVSQIFFRRIFQTVMNMEKRTTEMSSEGPKMVGERYGSAWNGRKMTNPATQGGGCAVLAGPIWVRPAAAGREISRRRLSGGGAPPWPARVQWWWPESAPTAETRMA